MGLVMMMLLSIATSSPFNPSAHQDLNQGIQLIKQYNHRLNITREALPLLLGQGRHETGKGYTLTESLNYSCKALTHTFKYYRTNKKKAYKHGRCNGHRANQQAIANHAYYGRNGNTSVGDGWKFRGRGLGMLTGKGNYMRVHNWLVWNIPSLALEIDIPNHVDRVSHPRYAMITFVVWLKVNNLPLLKSDRGSSDRISKVVNYYGRTANIKWKYTQYFKSNPIPKHSGLSRPL